MPVARFQMPDGKIARFEVPEGTTPEAAQSMIGENISTLIPSSGEQGFLDRASAKVGERLKDVGTQLMSGEKGDQNPVQNAYNIAGDAAAMFGDVAGEGIKSAYNSLPSAITGRVNNAASSAVNYAANTDAGKNIQGVAQGYGELAKQYPQAAKLIDSTANLALNIPMLKGASAVGETAGNAVSKAGQAIGDASDLKSVMGQVDADALKAMAKPLYDNPRLGTITPDFRNKWFNDVAPKLSAPADAAEIIGGSPVDAYLGRMQESLGKPLSFGGAEAIDKDLTQKITSSLRGGANADATAYGDIQQSLRNVMDSVPGDNAELSNARGLWSAQAKLRDLEAITERAQFQNHPSTGIQSGAKQIVKSPMKSRGYTPEELAKLKGAARKGIAVSALDTAGSRLGPLLAGIAGGVHTGGIGGAAAAGAADYVIGGIARKGAEALQAGKLAKVADAIKSRPVVQEAIKDAVASGQLAPRFTALKALGVTLDTTGTLMRGSSPFTLKQAMRLSPAQGKAAAEFDGKLSQE